MGVLNKIFNGKMNLDASPYRMPSEDYMDALNVSVDAETQSSDKVVSVINGNTLVVASLPAGSCKCLGKFEDKVRNRVYDFIWNSNGNHQVRYYDASANTITALIEDLTDTGGEPVLNFNPSKRINHVDIIYRDDEGDLLFWTDGNTTPKKINVPRIENGDYSVIKEPFIEVAKAPFLSPPTCAYGSDATRNSNSLRKTLFQFCVRPQYDDYEKGVLFSFSKIPLPIGFYGSDNDTDNTKNNFITITTETGDENVIAIEIGMRYNIGNGWSDVVLVASLNKDQLDIPNNSTYQFLFYNDLLYPTISDGVQYLDGVQSIPLFYWVPRLAEGQVLANGNVPVYGAITEGYNNMRVDDLDITITAENKTNSPPDTDPPALTYELQSTNYVFTVSGSVPTGTFYQVIAFVMFPSPAAITLASYTSGPGDGTSDVAMGLAATVSPTYLVSQVGSQFTVNFPGGGSILQVNVSTSGGGGGGDTISTEKVWMDDCPYAFGLVYTDEQGAEMPGVQTFSNPVDSDNDFLLTTPSFTEDSGARQTAVISASINHLPPAGAVKYWWVRRRMQYSNWLEYETCDFQDPGDGFYYLCLDNIPLYKEANSQFIYSAAPIVENGNQRIKVKAGINSNVYDGNVWNLDFQILGTATRTLTSGTTPDDDKLFIKIKKPTSVPSPVFQANMLVMVYTPFANPSGADAVYWEWGESYDIYDDGGVMRHRGMDQDQTSSQPATFTWEEGDAYYHTRTMYNDILGASGPNYPADTVSIMDDNYSDFFQSAVNDNGRANVIEVNAKSQYNPVLVRFGGAYQAGTNINETGVFYFDNFDEYDRGYGDIRKMFIDKRYMYVFQRFDIGVVPIFTQIIKDTSGNPLEANSEQLLNRITYPYQGKFGIGDIPESFAFGKGAKYFIDSNKGAICRLSQDGITVLSVLYEINSFAGSALMAFGKGLDNGFTAPGGTYMGNPTVHGGFNQHTNKYIVSMEQINRYDAEGNLVFHQDAYTFSFNETRDKSEGFGSFYSFHTEMIGCLNNLFITYKNGQFWRHDSSTFANFYGVQYEATITAVFNESPLEKKTFISLTEIANYVWNCPEIYTDINSYGQVKQQSNLRDDDFTQLEGSFHASFLRDANSSGGIINGDTLKGKYCIVKFKASNPAIFTILHVCSLKYITSPLSI